ncbi:hypothetical protein ANDA3_2510 [plant metagenome]|uniref:Uncharacterized protein n=1 Tax=plant metagenome TaxID=1297885 RepID=A0A484TL11_9ZZZZ
MRLPVCLGNSHRACSIRRCRAGADPQTDERAGQCVDRSCVRAHGTNSFTCCVLFLFSGANTLTNDASLWRDEGF